MPSSFTAIVGQNILGPFFIEGNLTAARYLQENITPHLTKLYYYENDPNVISNTLWFQHDGAPPHYSDELRTYLNKVFPEKWIGCQGRIEWPPDLTPLDFFLWGYMKRGIYLDKPNNLNELVQRIR